MAGEIAKTQKMDPRDVALALSRESSIFFNVAKFEHCQRIANLFRESKIWPDELKTVGDAMIILNLAQRLNTDPVMLAQNVSVIHGKPGFEGKLVIALVNGCGRFEPIEFRIIGNLKKPENGEDGCIAYAKEIKSGKILEGTKVDWDIVQLEGWYNKPGSKWKTMAPLMFRYRAATYFARTYCPEVLLGMFTREELQDIGDVIPRPEIQSIPKSEKPKVSKETYQTKRPEKLEVPEPKEDDQEPKADGSPPDKGKERNAVLIAAFKNKHEKGLLEFEKAHRSEILTWPQEVFDIWCDKFNRTTGEDYVKWTRKPIETRIPGVPKVGQGIVMCQVDGAAKTYAACENACPNPELFEKQECLERFPE